MQNAAEAGRWAFARGFTTLTKLVYIGGYGRSGTTLLEYLLTESPGVVACGEIARHLQRFGSRKTCTCGRALKDCPVWGTFDHRTGKLTKPEHETLALALLASLSGYTAMVDSSKTAWGSLLVPFRLQKRLGRDFLLIHLVRHPTAVCWSTMRTPRRRRDSRLLFIPSIRCLRTAIGWTVANTASEIFGWLYPSNYIRLRYEDLTRSTQEVLGGIFNTLSVQLPPATKRERSDNRHQLYGNSVRFRPVSIQNVKEDVAWKTATPRIYRYLAMSISWPLGAKYGYIRPLYRLRHGE